MSSSGLIYAVIVGAWAAYLVPMWLRRQDELNDARPTERFTTAIRMLTGRAAADRRRSPAPGARTDDAATPGEPDGTYDADRPRTDPAPHGGEDRPAAGRAFEERAARARVLARRRRTTMVLFLALTVGAVAAAVGGVRLLWAPAAPAVLLTVYVVYLRGQERHRHAVKLDQRRAEAAARQLHERRRATVPEPAAAPAPTPAPTATADRRALVEETDHAEWIDQQRAPRGPSGPDGWDPVPVPLPTYVNAPVAPRSATDVDLGAPDAWSSARAEPPADERRPTPTPLYDQYADDTRPRAANG
ncbi:hypothetical protein JJV70_17805 [Streptomyces sp. JJ66]|uniref:divisome protein SepX/GlpR n=1 Tax=Streptomyces sp. JJ66 TaxID=2803843 RepID=UPI001C5873CF|nr:hypothetical protein [Streptomyces sp. JJ66]MBW1603924.1 hypothetical protein [Streptomyces sp. JJ66]